MEPAASAAPSADPADPPQDHPATTLPNNIAVILHAARILLRLRQRHLIETVRARASTPNFNAIAASFGNANLSNILSHLNLGLLRRATALERVLLARAATGRRLRFRRTPLHPHAENRSPPQQPPNHSSPPPNPPPPPRERHAHLRSPAEPGRSRMLHAHIAGPGTSGARRRPWIRPHHPRHLPLISPSVPGFCQTKFLGTNSSTSCRTTSAAALPR